MKSIACILINLIIIAASLPVAAQHSITAIRVEKAPIINGILDDEVWQQAAVVTEFYQREPNFGAPVSEKTEVYICYNSDYIFFGFRCYDDPAKITAKEMARDISLGNDDRVQIILDTYNDRRNAFWFQIGPRGSIGDAIVSDNGAFLNKEWDGLWNGKAKIIDIGWEAEVAIPFKTLGFDKANTDWGIKLIRNIIRKLELSYWPVANLNSQKFQVSDAGTLQGIENISQGIGLDISPYIVAGFNTKKGFDNKTKLTGGADIFYQITPGLKSSLTINTDFAETEVDDRQINLTRFGLHFPEKRDFFLDGANYFQFGLETDQSNPVAKKIIPFFSRRMGLDNSGLPAQINYGGKLAGQIKSWNVGIMHINDDRGDRNQGFTVARVTHNLGKQSSVGLIGTYGSAEKDATNLLYGFDLKLASSVFIKNKNVSLLLFGLKSKTPGFTGNDAAWGFQFNYPNDFLLFRAGYHQIGDDFKADMGFVPRLGIRESYSEIMFGPRPRKYGILQVLTGGSIDLVSNLAGATETREIGVTPLKVRFTSGEELTYSLVQQVESLEKDFNIFNNFVIPSANYSWWKQSFKLKTKGSRKLWADTMYTWGDFYNGKSTGLQLGLNWKVAVPLFLGGKYQVTKVKLPAGTFNAKIYQASINLLFSPQITLNNYLQYDNSSYIIGFQSRFQWIVKPGNEIILVYTGSFNQPSAGFIPDASAARFKLRYNIRF